MRQIILLITGIAILPLNSGCWLFCKAPEPISVPNVGSFHQKASTTIRRVAVLPMESSNENSYAAKQLRDSIVQSLRENGAFEIVEIEQTDLGPCKTNVVVNGRYNERQLVWLMKQHNVDAVMYSRLNHVRVQCPQSWSTICHIVDAREASIIATAEGAWDLSTPSDDARFQKFIAMQGAHIYNPKIAHKSIQAVANFIGKEVALELY